MNINTGDLPAFLIFSQTFKKLTDMKRPFIPIVAIATLSLMYSCKSKNKEAASDTTAAQEPAKKEAATTTPANEPKTYTVTFSPDTVLLGKDKEAAVKIKNAKAVALQDPDGKDQGIELTFDLDVTNKNKLGGSHNIFFRTDNFRLTLDNGQNITQDDGAAEGVDPESTKELKGIKYKIAPGSRPKTLNLFHDQTRASVGVELK